MGEGNIDIDEYVRQYTHLCPGKALSLEIIVTGTREFKFLEPNFWDGYRNVPAWQFARFLALADKGTAPASEAKPNEIEDLEASILYTQRLLNL